MKKRRKIVIVSVFTIFLLIIGISGYFISQTETVPVDNISLDTVIDGTYTGNSKNGMITIEVEVTVLNNKITKVNIEKHANGLGSKAEKIVENVISEQTLQIDTIAGATYSSNMILKAIENALEKGVKN